MHNYAYITRKKSKRIYVGKVPIGNYAPIAVQSMTNTSTTNIKATINQIKTLEKAGVDIVRVSIPTMDDADALKVIKNKVNVPLVADVHFNYRIALKVIEYGIDCLRINPSNIGNKNIISLIVNAANDKGIPIRIGINAGSLERDLLKKYIKPSPKALLESVMRYVNMLDQLNFKNFKVSIKSSDVFMTIQSYRLLAKHIDNPIHIGVTESGGILSGTVKSSIGLGILLSEGIGDTLRVSLTADPVEEVKVGFNILKSLHIRNRGINFISCPTCARQKFDVINTINALEKKLEDIVTPISVSIIGCIVNGPGEALFSTIGVTGKSKKSILYENGIRQSKQIDNNSIIEELESLIRSKVSMMKKNNCINFNLIKNK